MKQTIGLLAFSDYSMLNYGGVLQAFALKKALCNLNDCDTRTIQNICYKPNAYHSSRKHFIVSSIYNFLVKPLIADRKRTKRTKDFYNQYIFSYHQSFEKNNILSFINKTYSKIIIGSDQVLNPQINNYSEVYLGNGITAKIYYYAASFGSSSIDEKWKNAILNNKKNLNSMSVREQTGKTMFNSLGFNNVRVDIDPTLLLEKEEWKKLANNNSIKFPTKYVFCYIMPGNKNVVKKIKRTAQTIARKRKCSVIYCGQKDYTRLFERHNVSGIGPIEWVYAILNAEAVVTNSFHGTAFAINLNKPFIAFTNKNCDSERNNFSSRIYDLAGLLSLNKHIDPKTENFDYIFELDFDYQNRILNDLRKESLTYLRGILND